jgi:hypothetical protein
MKMPYGGQSAGRDDPVLELGQRHSAMASGIDLVVSAWH